MAWFSSLFRAWEIAHYGAVNAFFPLCRRSSIEVAQRSYLCGFDLAPTPLKEHPHTQTHPVQHRNHHSGRSDPAACNPGPDLRRALATSRLWKRATPPCWIASLISSVRAPWTSTQPTLSTPSRTAPYARSAASRRSSVIPMGLDRRAHHICAVEPINYSHAPYVCCERPSIALTPNYSRHKFCM